MQNTDGNTLKGKIVFLRPLIQEDIGTKYATALNDPAVVRYIEARNTKWSKEKLDTWLMDAQNPPESAVFGIFLLEDVEHVGNLRLNMNSKHNSAELGILVFDKTIWGRGIGTEAVNLGSQYAFDRLGARKISAEYYSPNLGSARLFEKAGYIVEGVFRDHCLLEGKIVDRIRIAKFRK